MSDKEIIQVRGQGPVFQPNEGQTNVFQPDIVVPLQQGPMDRERLAELLGIDLTSPTDTPPASSLHGDDRPVRPDGQPCMSVGWKIYKELLADLSRECEEMVKNGELSQEEATFRYDMVKDEILESLPDELFATFSQQDI